MIETRQLGVYVAGLYRSRVCRDHLRQLLTLVRAHHQRWMQEPSEMSVQGAAGDCSSEQLLVMICNATHCPCRRRQVELWEQCGATAEEIAAAERLVEAQSATVDWRQAELDLASWLHGLLPQANLVILHRDED